MATDKSNKNPAKYTDLSGNVHICEILKFSGDQARIAVWKPGITRDIAVKLTVPVESLSRIRRKS